MQNLIARSVLIISVVTVWTENRKCVVGTM